MNILFVCATNEVLSQMAEGIFAHLLKKEGIKGVYCTSRGISVKKRGHTHENACLALKEVGVLYKARKAKRLYPITLGLYNYVITMTNSQKLAILKHNKKKNIYSLNDISGCGDIHDPSGDTLEGYEIIAKELHDELYILVQAIKRKLEQKQNDDQSKTDN